MNQSSLYCSTCQKHTPHVYNAAMYATCCSVCHSYTNQLERVHMAAIEEPLVAPDGTKAEVVENTPRKTVFYVPSGEHKGYYSYDKRSRQYSISQGG